MNVESTKHQYEKRGQDPELFWLGKYGSDGRDAAFGNYMDTDELSKVPDYHWH